MQERKIREIFKNDPDGTVFLLKIAAEDYQAATISLLKNAADNDIPIIYVGAKRPYVHLKKLLKNNHLSEEFIYVVDTITKTITDEGIVETEHVSYLDSPQNLTNVATSISVMAGKTGANNALLIIDSLETLLTYNPEREVSQFLDDLNGRTQTLELDLVLFKQDDSMDQKIGETLYPIVDNILLLSKEETETVYVMEQDDDHALVELPSDVARAMEWEEGDELAFTLSNNTLELTKK